MTTPDDSVDDLIASLDASFGKQARAGRSRSTRAEKKDATALQQLASARGQLTRMDMSAEAFETHREMLLANELSKTMDLMPSWIPDARITYCIRQHCDTCGNNVDFIGGEYVRFQSRRQRATIIRRAEVCSDLMHYGFAGIELEDIVEKHYQTVARCPGCIEVEEQALEIWMTATTPQAEQAELPAVPEKPYVPLTGNQLQALVERPFGEKFKKPKPKEDLEIEL